MNCTLLTTTDLALDVSMCRFLHDRLTWPDSEFNGKLDDWINGLRPLRADGHIAVVRDQGELIGWARTETWVEKAPSGHCPWPTLEAYVSREYRGRGIAAFAASGLVSGPLQDENHVAVFAPAMIVLARRVGLYATFFERESGSRWVRR